MSVTMASLTHQPPAAAHSSVHDNFNQERHLYSQDIFKLNRAAALVDRRGLGAA
jgi:putative transposase